MVAGDRLLAPQHEARLRGLFAQARGEHLIHADAPAQHGAPLQRGARQDVAGLAGVDADARRVPVEQARDDVQPRPERGQGFEAPAQLHVGARAPRRPVRGADAVAHEQGREPPGRRRSGRAGSHSAPPDGNRLQPGEGHRHAHALEQRAPADFVRS